MSDVQPHLSPESSEAVAADAEHLFTLLLNLVLDGEKRLAAHLTAHGLTTPQFYVLKTLIEQGGQWGIGQIARAHGLTNATMTGLINRLEAMDPPLVQRMINTSDRRAITVVLTPAGRARYQAVQDGLLEQLGLLLRLIPAEERRRLIDELSRYVNLIVQLG